MPLDEPGRFAHPARSGRPRAHVSLGVGVILWGSVFSAGIVGCRQHPFADDENVARLAIADYVSRGQESLPELRRLAASNDLRVRRRAMDALGRITGQWGSLGDGILWKRSVAEAVNSDRPLLVLHLFGEFDQEFC
ncbi:MAG: hypothetical protein AB7O52_00105 [Planctomycetota bacterium]